MVRKSRQPRVHCIRNDGDIGWIQGCSQHQVLAVCVRHTDAVPWTNLAKPNPKKKLLVPSELAGLRRPTSSDKYLASRHPRKSSDAIRKLDVGQEELQKLVDLVGTLTAVQGHMLSSCPGQDCDVYASSICEAEKRVVRVHGVIAHGPRMEHAPERLPVENKRT